MGDRDHAPTERQGACRVESLLQSLPHPVIILDTGGRIQRWNPQATEMFGWREDEVLGNTLPTVSGRRQTVFEAIWQRAVDGEEIYEEEIVHETQDGREIESVVTCSPIYEGEAVDAIMVLIRDVTVRNEWARRLQQREMEIQEQKRELEDTNQKLELLNRIVRHDIGNDIQIVLGYARELRRTIVTESPDAGLTEQAAHQQAEQFEHIISKATHIDELTDVVGDLMAVMLGEEKANREMSIGAVLQRELENIEAMGEQVDIVLPDNMDGDTVKADDLLRTVFRNILTNAVRHNDTSLPKIAVSTSEQEATMTIRIADNGPGVPEEKRDEIFGRGKKGLESDGSGVGLYLVDMVVDSYGGDVWVEESELGGAAFVVKLPKVDEPTATAMD